MRINTSFIIALLVLTGACSTDVGEGPGADLHAGSVSVGEDAPLFGMFEYVSLFGSYEEFSTLLFRHDGTYVAELPGGVAEEGTFKSGASTFVLFPADGEAREYGVEGDLSSGTIQISWGDRVELMMSVGLTECFGDADCGEDRVCRASRLGAICEVEEDTTGPIQGPEDCDVRTGGAFVTFDLIGEGFTVWSTNDAFIDRAIELVGDDGFNPTPVFNEVIAGAGCDSRYSWHVGAEDMAWGDFTTEVCDAAPHYIEENTSAWIDRVGQWCPWGPDVISVDDRR